MERITLQEFRNLPYHEQKEIVSKAGKFVENRVETNKRTELYAIDKFFVEVEVTQV